MPLSFFSAFLLRTPAPFLPLYSPTHLLVPFIFNVTPSYLPPSIFVPPLHLHFRTLSFFFSCSCLLSKYFLPFFAPLPPIFTPRQPHSFFFLQSWLCLKLSALPHGSLFSLRCSSFTLSYSLLHSLVCFLSLSSNRINRNLEWSDSDSIHATMSRVPQLNDILTETQ